MPDITLAADYKRRVTATNNRYLREVRKALRDNRSVLLDVLARLGLRHPQLIPQFAREIESLGREVVKIGRPYTGELAAISTAQIELQLAQLVEAGLSVPTVEAVERVVGTVPLMVETPPAWTAVYYGSLISEINRLINAGDVDNAAGSLFAERIDDRASVYRKTLNAAVVESDKVIWGVAVGQLGTLINGVGTLVPYPIQKQAIAAIDERTTDCCLRVHGQIQPLDHDFHLTGTPRYADYLPRPPFHWRCRTSETIYHPIVEGIGISTDQMRSAARYEIDKRVEEGRQVIHPAHAISKR